MNNSVELVSIEELEDITLAEYSKKRKELDIQKKKLSLVLDGEKLNQSLQIINSMSIILDKIQSAAYEDSITAKDIEALSSAYDKLNNALSKISRLDSADGRGTPNRAVLYLEFGE